MHMPASVRVHVFVCVCILVEKPNIIKIKASVGYVCVDVVAAPQF